MSEDLANLWKRRNKIVEERNKITTPTSTSEKPFEYEQLQKTAKDMSIRPKQTKNQRNLVKRPQNKVQQNEKHDSPVIPKIPEIHSISPKQPSPVSNSQHSSQSSSKHVSEQSSKSNSRQQSPLIQRPISPIPMPAYKPKKTNKRNIFYSILFICAILSVAAFFYFDNERFCDDANGQMGVDGCRKCPKYSFNCSLYSFSCDNEYYIKHDDGYCVLKEYFEEFNELREELKQKKRISLSDFILNKDSETQRDGDKVVRAISLCNDVYIDNDDVVFVESKRNFSLLYLAIAFLISIVGFMMINE